MHHPAERMLHSGSGGLNGRKSDASRRRCGKRRNSQAIGVWRTVRVPAWLFF
jgi:hypothetical protein